MNNSNSVYRFAPSPTGQMHIGNLRSAIFNWLIARSTGAKFYLRIEDTDLVRSTKEASDEIFRSLKWVGIDWDNEPVYQSQRFDLYKQWAQKLIDANQAYFCTCTSDHIDELRQATSADKGNFRYPGHCREKGIKEGFGSLPLRFKVNKQALGEFLEFEDSIKGVIKTSTDFLDDIVLVRSDGSPTYNLCVVIDDTLMGVTHVVRGEDHIPNTPKQILLYHAFGWAIPRFGHLPMVLDASGAKLSKRSGTETSVSVYRKQGIVPEALFNYLVRLGWSHGDQEVFTQSELVKIFSSEKIGKKGACFDIKKLQWLNGVHIKKLSVEKTIGLIKQMDSQDYSSLEQVSGKLLEKTIELYLPKAKDLRTLLDDLLVLFELKTDGFYNLHEFENSDTKELVSDFVAKAQKNDCESEEQLMALAKEVCASFNKQLVDLAQPLRVCLTGQKVSPSIFAIMAIFGVKVSRLKIDKYLLGSIK